MTARPYLTPGDDDFDNMHHALGRPAGRWVKPYRNFFVCAADGADAKRFEILGSYWERGGLLNGGRAVAFRVTPHGIREVMAWLALRERAAGLRPWVVSGRGIATRTVVAKSAGAAKFSVWGEISDVWPDGYRTFLKQTDMRARLA